MISDKELKQRIEELSVQAELHSLRKLLALTAELLRAVTLSEMGGLPDLFGPAGGWEAWDGRAETMLLKIDLWLKSGKKTSVRR